MLGKFFNVFVGYLMQMLEWLLTSDDCEKINLFLLRRFLLLDLDSNWVWFNNFLFLSFLLDFHVVLSLFETLLKLMLRLNCENTASNEFSDARNHLNIPFSLFLVSYV